VLSNRAAPISLLITANRFFVPSFVDPESKGLVHGGGPREARALALLIDRGEHLILQSNGDQF